MRVAAAHSPLSLHGFAAFLLVVSVCVPPVGAGYWQRVDNGAVLLRPTDWSRQSDGGIRFTVKDASVNSFSSFYGFGVFGPGGNTTTTVIKWGSPPQVMVPGVVVPVSGRVDSVMQGGLAPKPYLNVVFDVPGMQWFCGSGSNSSLLRIDVNGSKTNATVMAPSGQSGDRWVYYHAGFGEGTMMSAAFKYRWVEAAPPTDPKLRAGGPLPTAPPSTRGQGATVPPATQPTPPPISTTEADKLMAAEMGTRQAMETDRIFFNGNDGGVGNGGKSPTFTLTRATRIHFLWTYHWNDGKGAVPGTIGFRRTDGTTFGPWAAAAVRKVYWVANPDVVLPAGRYKVIDSDPATWAHNPGSGGLGHTMVKGRAAR